MYSQLPETTEIQFAKTVTELQSEVGGWMDVTVIQQAMIMD